MVLPNTTGFLSRGSPVAPPQWPLVDNPSAHRGLNISRPGSVEVVGRRLLSAWAVAAHAEGARGRLAGLPLTDQSVGANVNCSPFWRSGSLMGHRLCSHVPRRSRSPWVRHLVELSGRAGDCDGMPFRCATLCTRYWASPGLASQSSGSRQCPFCSLPLGGTLRTQPRGAVGEPLFYRRVGFASPLPSGGPPPGACVLLTRCLRIWRPVPYVNPSSSMSLLHAKPPSLDFSSEKFKWARTTKPTAPELSLRSRVGRSSGEAGRPGNTAES